MTRPTTLIVLTGIAMVLAITGPFDTDVVLRFVPRLVYWLCVSSLTYCVGYAVTSAVEARLHHWPRVALFAAMGVAAGVCVAFVVLATNYAIFGVLPKGADMLAFLATVFSISFIITLLLAMISEQLAADNSETSRPPALLDRLSLENRGALVSLSVEDHYVRVRTRNGEEMVLMRLGDAMKEVGDVTGLQVHRSHWVALEHVRAAKRQGDRAILTMMTGDEIPVSRTYLAAIKQAGLLPSKA